MTHLATKRLLVIRIEIEESPKRAIAHRSTTQDLACCTSALVVLDGFECAFHDADDACERQSERPYRALQAFEQVRRHEFAQAVFAPRRRKVATVPLRVVLRTLAGMHVGAGDVDRQPYGFQLLVYLAVIDGIRQRRELRPL